MSTSLIKALKKTGPKIELWGTPLVTGQMLPLYYFALGAVFQFFQTPIPLKADSDETLLTGFLSSLQSALLKAMDVCFANSVFSFYQRF